VDVYIVKFLSGALADGADANFVEIFELQTAGEETFGEVLDAVGAGEDQPVVAVEMIEGFVEALVAVGFANLDRRTDKNLRAIALEECG
jgi:hypothetical protein